MGAVQEVRTVRGTASPAPPPRNATYAGPPCGSPSPGTSCAPDGSPPSTPNPAPLRPRCPAPQVSRRPQALRVLQARPLLDTGPSLPSRRPPRPPTAVSPRLPPCPVSPCTSPSPCPLGLSPLGSPHPYSLPAVALYSRVPGTSPRGVPPARPVSPPRVSPPPRAPAELWDRRAQEVAGRRGRGRRAAGRAGRDGGRGRRAPHSLRPDAGPGAPRARAQRPERPGGDAGAERDEQVAAAAGERRCPQAGPPPGPPPEVGAASTAAPGRPDPGPAPQPACGAAAGRAGPGWRAARPGAPQEGRAARLGEGTTPPPLSPRRFSGPSAPRGRDLPPARFLGAGDPALCGRGEVTALVSKPGPCPAVTPFLRVSPRNPHCPSWNLPDSPRDRPHVGCSTPVVTPHRCFLLFLVLDAPRPGPGFSPEARRTSRFTRRPSPSRVRVGTHTHREGRARLRCADSGARSQRCRRHQSGSVSLPRSGGHPARLFPARLPEGQSSRGAAEPGSSRPETNDPCGRLSPNEGAPVPTHTSAT
nr:basic proline-rich protein-like [Kogia breviceps]